MCAATHGPNHAATARTAAHAFEPTPACAPPSAQSGRRPAQAFASEAAPRLPRPAPFLLFRLRALCTAIAALCTYAAFEARKHLTKCLPPDAYHHDATPPDASPDAHHRMLLKCNIKSLRNCPSPRAAPRTDAPPAARLAQYQNTLAPNTRSASHDRVRHPRACASPMHTGHVHHLRPITHAHPARLAHARPAPSPYPRRNSRSLPPFGMGSAERLLTHRHARRDRHEAHPASSPPSHAGQRFAPPPADGHGATTGARTNRSTAPDALECHGHAAAPRTASPRAQHPHTLAMHAYMCT